MLKALKDCCRVLPQHRSEDEFKFALSSSWVECVRVKVEYTAVVSINDYGPKSHRTHLEISPMAKGKRKMWEREELKGVVRVLCCYPINPSRLSNQCHTGADRCTPTLPR